MRASGLRLLARAVAALTTTSAAAPSESMDELAAVTVPSLPNAGFRFGIFAMSQLNGVSSFATHARLAVLHGDGRDFSFEVTFSTR